MIYITGDTHGNFDRIENFCNKMKTTKDDIMIILGDAGINYFLNFRDTDCKRCLLGLPITFFCIHGNHEERPQNILTYREKEWNGGKVYFEYAFPNILFANDGDIYDLDGKKCLVLGGAYSVDKNYRLTYGFNWFESEQMSNEQKLYAERNLNEIGNKVDIVFSHTCPRKYEPTEMFSQGVDQETVDKNTEDWLDTIEEKTEYEKWYCGHWHISKNTERLKFMFEDYGIL